MQGLNEIQFENQVLQHSKGMFEDAHVAVLWMNDTGGVIDVNPSASGLFGYSVDELGVRGIWHLIPEQEITSDDIWRQLKIRDNLIEDVKLRDKNDSVVFCRGWVKMNVSTGVHCIVLSDISRIKELEKRVDEDELIFRSVFEGSSTAMAVVLPNGRYKHVNEGLCRMLGYSEHELAQLSFRQITYFADLRGDELMLSELGSGKIKGGQRLKRYHHKSGKLVSVSINVSSVHNAQGTMLYMITRVEDITDRRDSFFWKSDKRLWSLFEQNNEAIFLVDLEGQVEEINSAASALMTQSREMLLHRKTGELFSADYFKFFRNVAQDLRNEEHRGIHILSRSPYCPGVQLEIVVVPVIIDGQTLGAYCIARDVTEKYLKDRQRDIVLKIHDIFNEDSEFTHCLQQSLSALSQFMEARYSEVWTCSIDKKTLSLAGKLKNGEWVIDTPQKLYGDAERNRVFDAWKGRRIIISNPLEDLDPDEKDDYHSEMVIPIMVKEEVIGVYVFHFEKRVENVGTTAWSQSVGEQLALSMQRKKMFDVLNSYFRLAPDMLCIGGTDGYFKMVNPAFSKVLGYDSQQLLGSPFLEFVHPEDRSMVQHELLQLANGISSSSVENRYICKSGEIKWLLWNVVPLATEELVFAVARDITEERRLRSIILHEQKRFFEMFFEAPVSMCILKGPDHIFENANERYYNMSGRLNLIGKTVRQAFPEIGGQGFFELLDSVYATGLVYTTNEQLVRLNVDGENEIKDIYLTFMYQPYRNQDGEVEGIFFFGVDVSEQVLARKKIEENETRYRQIVETAQEGIWLLDEHDLTVFANKKMSDIIEFDEMTGRSFFEFVDEDMKYAASQILQRHRLINKKTFELKFVSRNGKKIWAQLNTNSITDEDGSYRGCLAMVTDVTERKRDEDELTRLSLIAKNTVNSVYITDKQGRIGWINESFTRITGYKLSDVAGKLPDEVLYGVLTDAAAIANIKESVLDETAFACEIIKYTKSQIPFWVEIQGQPLFDKGRLSHYFFIETDITERKSAFEKLMKTENEIRTFAMQLNNMLEGERIRIAREIHDEFGQQLTGLRMLLSSLTPMVEIGGRGGEIIADMRESLEGAQVSLRNLATELRPGILDTLGLMPSIDWLAKSFEKRSGIKFLFKGKVTTRSFEEKVSITFFRICQEAFTNVAKHSQASKVDVQLIETSASLSLTVRDDGRGMPEEQINNSFSMGILGMRERAKLINANFKIESRENSGTNIHLVYPII